MLIECPSCHTRARLSDDKAGSKVRCPQCGRVWVAGLGARGGRADSGARGGRGADDITRKVVLGVGGLMLLALVFYFNNNASPTEVLTAAPEEVVVQAPVRDTSGWDSELVKIVRSIHREAAAAEEGRLLMKIHGERAWERRQRDLQAAGDTGSAAWATMTRTEQSDFVLSLVDGMVRGEHRDLIATRNPFDGSVIEEGDEVATVRVQADPIDLSAGADAIWIEWLLAKDGKRWKAFSWERWISPDELRAQRRRVTKRIQKRTLSDGSFVIESEVRPVPHLDTTSAQEAQRIDQLVTQLIDLDARPRVRTEADRALQAIGKPAIPALLTQLATIPLVTEEQAMQLNLIHLALTDLTGYVTTFRVHELLGATRERQESGLKQWFGWYDRKFKRFEVRENVDPFEGVIEPTEREKRQMERDARRSGR